MAIPPDEVQVWRVELGQRKSRPVLREVLSHYLEVDPGAIELRLGPNGKPELASGGVQFNLSHSAALAYVAVSEAREVGVDVERVKFGRDFLAIAARALGPDAVAELRESEGDERAYAFYDLWVRHEARLKCGGGGLGGPPPGGPMVITPLMAGPGYAAALAIAGAGAPPVRCFYLEPD